MHLKSFKIAAVVDGVAVFRLESAGRNAVNVIPADRHKVFQIRHVKGYRHIRIAGIDEIAVVNRVAEESDFPNGVLRIIGNALSDISPPHDLQRLVRGDRGLPGSRSGVGRKGTGQSGGIAVRTHDHPQRGIAQRVLPVSLLIGIEGVTCTVFGAVHRKKLASLFQAEQGRQAADGFNPFLRVVHRLIVVFPHQHREISVVGKNSLHGRIRVHGLHVFHRQLPNGSLPVRTASRYVIHLCPCRGTPGETGIPGKNKEHQKNRNQTKQSAHLSTSALLSQLSCGNVIMENLPH